MSEVSVIVNGNSYRGWKNVSISRDLKDLSGSFELSITDSWAVLDQGWAIKPLDACEVRIDNETVITGFVDAVEANSSPTSREITVSGRDKVADIIDCGYPGNNIEFASTSLLSFIKTLIKPFGLEARIESGVSQGANLPGLTYNSGDTVYNVIEKWARTRGVLLQTDENGVLILTKPGNSQAEVRLVEGGNVLSCSMRLDFSDRFSSYSVHGDANLFSKASSVSVYGTTTDPIVNRLRPKIMKLEGTGDSEDASKRAKWEASNRAANSEQVSVSVVGWRQTPDGSLWKVNSIVRVNCPSIGANQDMLISSVNFGLSSEGGEVTDLQLTRPDAYRPEPLTEDNGVFSPDSIINSGEDD
jgi:prophage tail gpP-like protein